MSLWSQLRTALRRNPTDGAVDGALVEGAERPASHRRPRFAGLHSPFARPGDRPVIGNGRPALVRETEHRDAETFEPIREFAAIGPGRLRAEHDGTFESWLANEKTDADFAAEEQEFAAEFYAQTPLSSPDFVARAAAAAIREHLRPFMDAYGITADELRAYGKQLEQQAIDEAATRLIEGVGDFDGLRERIAHDETRTGEWPIVVPVAVHAGAPSIDSREQPQAGSKPRKTAAVRQPRGGRKAVK